MKKLRVIQILCLVFAITIAFQSTNIWGQGNNENVPIPPTLPTRGTSPELVPPLDFSNLPPTEGELIHVELAGEATRSIFVDFFEHVKFQLPQNAILGGIVAFDECKAKSRNLCPKLPGYVVVLDSGEHVVVDQRGKLYEIINEEDGQYQQYRGKFQWLEEQLRGRGHAPEWVTRKDVQGRGR